MTGSVARLGEDRGPGWQVWLLFAAAIALRLPALSRPLYLDELASLDFIDRASALEVLRVLRTDVAMPGYFLLLYFWRQVSHEVVWLRLLSLTFDAGTLLLLKQQLGRSSQRAAALGVLLWGCCPLALRFSVEIRPYAALGLASLAALIIAQKALQDSQKHGLRAATTLVWCALISLHAVGVFVIAAILTSLALTLKPEGSAKTSQAQIARDRAVRLGGALGIPAALSAIFFALLHWGYTLDPSAHQLDWMPKFSAFVFFTVFNNAYDAFLGGPSAGPAGAIFFALLLTFGALDRRGRGSSLAALFIILLAALVSVLFAHPIYSYRAIFPALILVVPGAALGLDHKVRRWGFILLAPLLVWQVARWIPTARRPVNPLSQMGQLAMAARASGDFLCTYPDYVSLGVQFLPGAPARPVAVCGESEEKKQQRGVAILRLSYGQSGDLVMDRLQRMFAAGSVPHDLFIVLSDDDDNLPDARQERARLVPRIAALLGACDIEDATARVGHLRCR